MLEILECEEFEELSIRISSLLHDGELQLDERITSKGYLSAAMKGGQIALRATKFVGTIPLTANLAIRVKPRATISNLSYMLVRSGVIPTAVSGFSRGYLPKFTTAENAEKIYGPSLVEGTKLIARRGLMKEYLRPTKAIPWRGRLVASDTARKHAAKGIRYKHEFDHSLLSSGTIENVSIRNALEQVALWFRENDPNNRIIHEITVLLRDMWSVPQWHGQKNDLVSRLGQKIRTLSPRLPHYRDPLWSSYLILQSVLPDIGLDGFVRLDSLIVDVSIVFEAYIRRELSDRLAEHGLAVVDGNQHPGPFFQDAGFYTVHPDIVIKRGDDPVAILDAKYKPDPKEKDRYEVLSFMDTMDVPIGGFVCPVNGHDTSRYLGTTASAKRMFSLRYDLAAIDPNSESERLARNVLRMIEGEIDFE